MNNNLYEYICSEVKNGNNHFFVTAQGGAGKTMQLRYIERELIKRAEKGEKIIPVYIDVKALDNSANYPVFNYIRRFFGKDVDVNDTKDLFELNNNTSFQEYTIYFLIDALNETIDDYKIIDDIRIICNCENCVVVMTSRVNEDISDSFITVEIKPLSKGQVFNMIEKKYDIDVFPNVEINQSLMELLQIPMFLVTLLKTYPYYLLYDALFNNKNTIRKAQILDAYKKKLINDLIERRNGKENEAIKFIINYYLPAVAYLMVKNNSFSLDRNYIDDVLNACYFEGIIKGSKKEKIKKMLNSNSFMPSTISSEGLALIVDNDDEWSFSHQIWRDYFCALHIVNVLKNTNEYSKLEIYLDEDIREFVGELFKNDNGLCECDFESKNDLDSPMSPIEEYMQKNYVNLNKNPHAIRGLIEIMKTSRNNMITAKYDNLDLRNTSFNNSFLSRSTFNNSKISTTTFYQTGHSADITAVEFATYDDKSYIISGDESGKVIFWDFESCQQIGAPFTEYPVYSGDYTSKAMTWHLESGKVEVSFPEDLHLGSIDYLKSVTINEKACLICQAEQEVYVWDIKERKIITVKGTSEGITACGYTCFDKKDFLITGDSKGTIKIWDINKESLPIELIDDSKVEITSITIIPYEHTTHIVCGRNDGSIKIWDFKDMKTVTESFNCHERRISSIIYVNSNSHHLLITGSDDSTIKVWDAKTLSQIGKTLKGHTGIITDLAYTRFEGKDCIISCSWDGTIRIWDIKSGMQIGEPLCEKDKENNEIESIAIALHNNGKYIISGGWNKNINIWNFEFYNHKPKATACCRREIKQIDYIRFDDISYLVSRSIDGVIRFWDIQTGRLSKKPIVDKSNIKTNLTSARINRRNCVIGGDERDRVRIWDIDTGEVIEDFNWIGDYGMTFVANAAVDGKNYILTGNKNGTIKVWDLKDKWHFRAIENCHKNGVVSIEFAIVDSKPIIISAGQEYSEDTIKLWDFYSGEQIEKTIEQDSSIDKMFITNIGHNPSVVIVSFASIAIINLKTKKKKSFSFSELLDNTTGLIAEDRNKHYLAYSEKETLSIWEMQDDCLGLTGAQKHIYTIPSIVFECDFENAIFEQENALFSAKKLFINGALLSQETIEKLSKKQIYEF